MGNSIPDSVLDRFFSGKIGRRKFLQLCSKSAVGLSLSGIVSCSYAFRGGNPELSSDQDITLGRALNVIFPKGDGSPSASDLHAVPYFHIVLLDPKVELEHKNLIRDGVIWLDEESQNDFGVDFRFLNSRQQEELISKISDISWGERWISRLLSYLFEALLGDPVYGGNPNEIGWKWLDHQPGYPRPSKPYSLIYKPV